MPRAPQLSERTVAPTALPGVRKQGAETFASSGGPVAQAQENFGRELAGVGLRAYAQVRQAENESAAALEQLTIRKRFNDLDHLLLQDTERGLLNKTGREPMDLQDRYVDEWDTTANDMISGEIKTEGGRIFFEQEKERRRDAFMNRAAAHSGQQMRVYRAQELDATLKSAVQAGALAADPRDPRAGEAVAFQLQVIDDSIDTNAQRLGLGPEQAKVMKEAARTQLHVGAVENLIARGKARDARDYFESIDDQISAPQRADLLTKLKNNTDQAAAFATANDIWDANAPADDKTPVQLDKLEAIARERAGGDPDVYRMTVAYLRDRKQGVDDARRARQNQRDDAIWGAVFKRAPLQQILALEEFKLAPAEDRIKVVEFLRREQEHNEALAASRESRAYTRAQRAQQELENQGWSEYFRLSDPKVLSGMSRAEIMAKLPTLGRDHTQRLVNDKEAWERDQNAAKSATVDREIFRDVAYNAGESYIYDPPGDMSEAQRARAGRLQSAIEAEVQAEAGRTPGGRVSLDKQREIAQRVVDRKVMLDVLGPDREAIAATVQDDERGVAYVPLAKVPDTMRQKFANYIRTNPRRSDRMTFELRPPSTMEIIQSNRAKIEKAYALYLLGRPDAEWQALFNDEQPAPASVRIREK